MAQAFRCRIQLRGSSRFNSGKNSGRDSLFGPSIHGMDRTPRLHCYERTRIKFSEHPFRKQGETDIGLLITLTTHLSTYFTNFSNRQKARFQICGGGLNTDVGQVRLQLGGRERIVLVVFGEADASALIGATTLELFNLAIDPVGKRLIPVVGLMKPVARCLKECTSRLSAG